MIPLRHITHAALAAAALLAGAQGAVACSVAAQSEAELKRLAVKLRQESLPVQTGADCAFRNGGLEDDLSAGPAVDRGNGWVTQRLMPEALDGAEKLLVVNCNAREAISLAVDYAPIDPQNYTKDLVEDGCNGLQYDASWGPQYPSVVAPEGPMDLAAFADVSAVVQGARHAGLVVDTRLAALLRDDFGRKYQPKDRIDLLCGCKLFYPESAGAS